MIRRFTRAAADDDPLIGQAVEELMRYLTVVATPLARIARQDAVLGGQHIRAGESVVCQLVVANRDEAPVSHPAMHAAGRPGSLPYAFGH